MGKGGREGATLAAALAAPSVTCVSPACMGAGGLPWFQVAELGLVLVATGA